MADACCDPLMNLSQSHAKQRRVLTMVLGINVVTFVMVVVSAWFSRSTALLSGGLDNLGDALTYALSLAVVGASLASQARVSVVKGFLILTAALFVAAQIIYRLVNPTVPIFETMGIVGLVNLGFNAICLWLLTPYRHGDVNMASAWECSRNDIYEGGAVLVAAGAVWAFDAGWPDLVIGAGLLALFLRSAITVLRRSFAALREASGHGPGPGKVQDPVCKCHIDPRTARHRTEHRGTTVHFCAEDCKRRFDADPAAFDQAAWLPIARD